VVGNDTKAGLTIRPGRGGQTAIALQPSPRVSPVEDKNSPGNAVPLFKALKFCELQKFDGHKTKPRLVASADRKP